MDEFCRQGPFDRFKLQLAKTAAEAGEYWLLEPAAHGLYTTFYANEFSLLEDAEFRVLMQTCRLFNRLVRARNYESITHPMYEHKQESLPSLYLTYKTTRRSLKALLLSHQTYDISFKERGLIAITFGAKPEDLHLEHMLGFDRDASFYDRLIQVRGQQKDFLAWFRKLLHLTEFTSYSSHSVCIDFSPCMQCSQCPGRP